METKVIKCSCYSPEHYILVTFNKEEKEVYFNYFLETQKWYKRILIGIKYIFGFRSKFGHFGEIIIDEKNTKVFKKIIKCISDEAN